MHAAPPNKCLRRTGGPSSLGKPLRERRLAGGFGAGDGYAEWSVGHGSRQAATGGALASSAIERRQSMWPRTASARKTAYNPAVTYRCLKMNMPDVEHIHADPDEPILELLLRHHPLRDETRAREAGVDERQRRAEGRCG